MLSPGDPNQWSNHVWTVLLPVGSPVGVWGLASMTVRVRAAVFMASNFTETLQFDVECQCIL